MKKYVIAICLFAIPWSFLDCTRPKTESFRDPEVRHAEISNVRLLGGPFYEAQQRDLEYLKKIVPDRLLASFRSTAGLIPKAEQYKGWEERELRGHFTGHYLSACSMMYAASGDQDMRSRVEYIVKELAECQAANQDGYLSAFPQEFIDRVEAVKPVWAPYYTIHKILAGLLDSYRYCQDTLALTVASNMADWIYKRCEKIPRAKMQEILNKTEQGGMNDVAYQLLDITGIPDYLGLASFFYQDSYFKPLSDFRDSLKGQHVNSFIPNVIGLAKGYDLTRNPEYRQICEYFWKTVTETRSFVTGGTSNGEIWGSDNYHIHSECGPSSHESCCTYNMLKLTMALWHWNQDPDYSDYYERALWNGILPTQDTLTGMSMYYVPMQSGYFKTFGTPENSFWCCTGTGVENFARAGESIYAVGNGKLFVDQYIASVLTLDSLGLKLVMSTDYPSDPRIKIDITLDKPKKFAIALRIPGWMEEPARIRLNHKSIPLVSGPGSYLYLERTWRKGDQIELELPMSIHIECMPDAIDTCAVMYGPVVLAARLGRTDINPEIEYGRYGPYDSKPVTVPNLDLRNGTGVIVRKGNPAELVFNAPALGNGMIEMVPFYNLFSERYAIYLPVYKKLRNNKIFSTVTKLPIP
jgi:DUF1680 family protein